MKIYLLVWPIFTAHDTCSATNASVGTVMHLNDRINVIRDNLKEKFGHGRVISGYHTDLKTYPNICDHIAFYHNDLPGHVFWYGKMSASEPLTFKYFLGDNVTHSLPFFAFVDKNLAMRFKLMYPYFYPMGNNEVE